MTIDDRVLSDECKNSDAPKREKPKDIYRLLDLFDELYGEAKQS